MSLTGVISIKCKQLQSEFGVSSSRSLREKLIRNGVVILKGEFVRDVDIQAVIDQAAKEMELHSAEDEWEVSDGFKSLMD